METNPQKNKEPIKSFNEVLHGVLSAPHILDKIRAGTYTRHSNSVIFSGKVGFLTINNSSKAVHFTALLHILQTIYYSPLKDNQFIWQQ